MTLKAGSGTVQLSTESGALKLGATCIDRSNWCGEWADTACSAAANAVKGGKLSLGSNGGPTLQAYSDGTLAFESLVGGGCVGILETTPTAAQLLQEHNQVAFGTTGRIYMDSTEKLWIQAGSLVDSASAVLVPPTAVVSPNKQGLSYTSRDCGDAEALGLNDTWTYNWGLMPQVLKPSSTPW
jgi:hypothetical protein